MLFQMIKQE